MPMYMVIERFKAGSSTAVYERFQTKGRMLPPGLCYIDSWLRADDTTCYQLMKTDDPKTFDKWIAHWDDLVEFEVQKLKTKPIKRFDDLPNQSM